MYFLITTPWSSEHWLLSLFYNWAVWGLEMSNTAFEATHQQLPELKLRARAGWLYSSAPLHAVLLPRTGEVYWLRKGHTANEEQIPAILTSYSGLKRRMFAKSMIHIKFFLEDGAWKSKHWIATLQKYKKLTREEGRKINVPHFTKQEAVLRGN